MPSLDNTIKLRKAQVELIERLTLLYKDLPPAMAKINALLYVCDETELTFDQIKDTLKLSKGATSQGINHLILTKKIEYVSHLNDRKRYFRARISSWKQDLKEIHEGLGVQTEIYREILKQRPTKTPEFNKDFKEMIRFREYIKNVLETAFEKFLAGPKE